MENNKPLSKASIIKEISNNTDLTREVVKSVIDCYEDIFLREVVLNECFRMNRCFTVGTKVRKEGKQWNVNKNKFELFPETKILTIKLSKEVHYFHRWKRRHEFNSKHGITVEDWKNRPENKFPSND